MTALQITQWGRVNTSVGTGTCSGCAGAWHKGCTVYDHTCASYHKTGHFTKVCRSKMTQHGPGQKHISPNAICLYLQQDTLKQMQMYAMTQTRREPAQP